MSIARRLTAVSALAVAAILVTGCASQRPADSAQSTGGDDGGGVFVFAASADPVSLDPALSSDSESSRVANQIFEGLVGYAPGSADVTPLLATDWSQSDDGLSYDFTLRDDVTFSDGTDFNADAVCVNFDRWYNWTGPLQAQNISNLYQLIFGGFRTSDNPALTDGLYESCEAVGEFEARINLSRPYGSFIPALAISQFSMQSPTAMEQYDADAVEGEGTDVRFGEYATAHPTGTGPFIFDSWDRGQQVTLTANPDYWGEAPKIDTVIIKTIGDPTARVQALRSGEIDAYDLVAPGDIPTLESDGYQLLNRDPFNILYLGMDQATPELQDIRVRRAISHAIDKDALIAQTLPEGSEPATQFTPPSTAGWSPDVTVFDFDPDEAKRLLAEAGVGDLTLDFHYPTGISRPYMPNPEDLFVALRTQLEAVGITVNGIPQRWSPDYLDTVKAEPGHGIYLLGGTLIMNAPETLGIFFGSVNTEWGFDNPAIFDAVASARSEISQDASAAAYEAAGVLISDFIPGVPLAHVPVTVALRDGVGGYVTNPSGAEVWNTVTVG